MTTSDYITRRYGPSANRHWWGIAHRRWLLDSGRYVRSGEQRSARAGLPAGLRVIGERGPELVNFRPHHRGSAIGMGDQHWPGCGHEPNIIPGEHIYYADGSIDQVSDDGHTLHQVQAARED